MKRILGTALAAVLAAGAGLVAPAAAGAVPSDVVTSAEFNKVAYGNSLDYVRKTFGSNGTVTYRHDDSGTSHDSVHLEFSTYYDGGIVLVEFSRRPSGAWYLTDRYAYWDTVVQRTVDKATEPEFNRVASGNSIAHVRSTFGTAGTVMELQDLAGTRDDFVIVQWPTESVDGLLEVGFVKSTSGVWKVDSRTASWHVAARRTADKATTSEFYQVKAGNTIDHARSTFGTGGTVTYLHDPRGTSSDVVNVEWPTESGDGFVRVGFGRSAAGAWRVVDRTGYWAVQAQPTSDRATQAEFETLALRMTLDDARTSFGTAGTVVYYDDGIGDMGDELNVEWYTGPGANAVSITFGRNPVGAWAILDTEDLWGPWNGASPRSTASSGAPRVLGTSVVDDDLERNGGR